MQVEYPNVVYNRFRLNVEWLSAEGRVLRSEDHLCDSPECTAPDLAEVTFMRDGGLPVHGVFWAQLLDAEGRLVSHAYGRQTVVGKGVLAGPDTIQVAAPVPANETRHVPASGPFNYSAGRAAPDALLGAPLVDYSDGPILEGADAYVAPTYSVGLPSPLRIPGFDERPLGWTFTMDEAFAHAASEVPEARDTALPTLVGRQAQGPVGRHVRWSRSE